MPAGFENGRQVEKVYESILPQENKVYLSAEVRHVMGILTVYIYYEVHKYGFVRTSPQTYLPKGTDKAEILYSTLLKGAALLPSQGEGTVFYSMPQFPNNLIPLPTAQITFKEISGQDNPTWQPLQDYADKKWAEAYKR